MGLQRHPEGGWFREVYISDDIVPPSALPSGFNGERHFSTSIYYLLEGKDFSAFHRIKSDEIWHYYGGSSAIEIVMLIDKQIVRYVLGANLEANDNLQVVVPKETWFAASLKNPNGFAVAGCTVSPGFNFSDFQLADEKLLDDFAHLKEDIMPLLKNKSEAY